MRYSPSKQYSVVLHGDAKSDLEQIWEGNEDAAADIVAFLEEAKLNQTTLDNLTRNGYINHGETPYSIREWIEAKRKRYNLWRIRLLGLEGVSSKYRIVYAFNPIELRYYILGIIDRKFNYELSHPISKRIITAYDQLGISKY